MELRRYEKLAEREKRDKDRKEAFHKILDKKGISHFWYENPLRKWKPQAPSYASQNAELPFEEDQENTAQTASSSQDQISDIDK